MWHSMIVRNMGHSCAYLCKVEVGLQGCIIQLPMLWLQQNILQHSCQAGPQGQPSHQLRGTPILHLLPELLPGAVAGCDGVSPCRCSREEGHAWAARAWLAGCNSIMKLPLQELNKLRSSFLNTAKLWMWLCKNLT